MKYKMKFLRSNLFDEKKFLCYQIRYFVYIVYANCFKWFCVMCFELIAFTHSPQLKAQIHYVNTLRTPHST